MTRFQIVWQPPRGLRNNFKAADHGVERAQLIVKSSLIEPRDELERQVDVVQDFPKCSVR
jgi:hypothetical protein